jgi:pre-mRNA-processing factor 19
MVVTGGVDGDAVLFSKSQRKKIATLSAHSKAVTQVTFHPESTVIATGSRDKTVRLWSAPDNSVDYKVKATFSGHKAEVTGVVFHPLNEYLVSSSMDQTWAFHSIETGQTLVTASAPSVSSPILSCDVHPDCLLLATGQQNGGVGLWNISTQSVVMSFGDHAGGVRGLKFSESGYEVITAGANEIALWDLRKMNQKKAIAQLPGKFDLSSIALTHSGAYVAASGSGIKIFDVASFEEVVTLSSHADRVTGIKWDRSGSSLASVSLDRNLKIFA